MTEDAINPSSTFTIDAALELLQQARAELIAKQHSTAKMTGTPLEKAVRLRRMRDKRHEQFGDDLFGEPAWDMLLDLFIAHSTRASLSISALAATDHTPPTTGLRWIAILENRGMLRREPDPFDGRRSWLVITDEAYARVKQWLEAF